MTTPPKGSPTDEEIRETLHRAIERIGFELFASRYDRMAALLRELEWAATQLEMEAIPIASNVCAICSHAKPEHAPDCRLAALLRELA